MKDYLLMTLNCNQNIFYSYETIYDAKLNETKRINNFLIKIIYINIFSNITHNLVKIFLFFVNFIFSSWLVIEILLNKLI